MSLQFTSRYARIVQKKMYLLTLNLHLILKDLSKVSWLTINKSNCVDCYREEALKFKSSNKVSDACNSHRHAKDVKKKFMIVKY